MAWSGAGGSLLGGTGGSSSCSCDDVRQLLAGGGGGQAGQVQLPQSGVLCGARRGVVCGQAASRQAGRQAGHGHSLRGTPPVRHQDMSAREEPVAEYN